MKNFSLITLIALALLACASLATAIASDSNSTEDLVNEKNYCLQKGGTLETMEMIDLQRRPTGIFRQVCVFRSETEGTKHLPLLTLFTPQESLAHRIFKVGYVRGISAPITVTASASPAAQFCLNNGALPSTWRNTTTNDEGGFCTFADASSMSDWALFYGSKRLPNLTKALRFQY
jgi:putative hemolysin